MSERKLSMEDIQLLNMLEKTTGARATDVVLSESSVIFVVEKGNLGKAIGKGGSNIHKVSAMLGKPVDIVEMADNVKDFITNALVPAVIKSMDEDSSTGKDIVTVNVDPKTKGLAIGKNGEKIKRTRLLAKRYFSVDEVRVL